jgi:hypothetical protein
MLSSICSRLLDEIRIFTPPVLSGGPEFVNQSSMSHWQEYLALVIISGKSREKT